MHRNLNARKMVSIFFVSFVWGTGCSNGFTSLGLRQELNSSQSSSSSSVWSQGQHTPLSGAENTLKPMSGSCYVYVTDGMNRDEELRVTLYSTDLWQLQVAVGEGDFFDLGATSGTLTWAGNSFPAGSYYLRFRGVLNDGTAVTCTPGAKTVTVYENVVAPEPTPTPPVVVNPSPQIPPSTEPATPPSSTSPPVPGEDKRNFRSLHSYPTRIAKKPAAGSYNYEFYTYTGFKNQYDPNDTMTACSLGILPGGDCAFPWTEASTVSLNFTEALIGYNVPRNFRFFIPEGSADVRMAGYAAQRTAFAFVIKMGSAPTRIGALSAADYSAAQVSENIDTSYARLARGDELIVVHDGGGTVRFLSGKAVTKGGWIYIRQLDFAENIYGMTPAASLYDLQLSVVADKASFRQHYQKMNFDTSGDPE